MPKKACLFKYLTIQCILIHNATCYCNHLSSLISHTILSDTLFLFVWIPLCYPIYFAYLIYEPPRFITLVSKATLGHCFAEFATHQVVVEVAVFVTHQVAVEDQWLDTNTKKKVLQATTHQFISVKIKSNCADEQSERRIISMYINIKGLRLENRQSQHLSISHSSNLIFHVDTITLQT